jgi:type II restriction enzyme
MTCIVKPNRIWNIHLKLGFEEQQSKYDSGSQKARSWTEKWFKDWAFCPNCGAESVQQFAANRPAADFLCSNCNEEYELKSQKNRFGAKVVDGAHRTMCERLESANNPNLVLLNYDLRTLSVTNLFVIPKHFFIREIIEERKPLSAAARRAGWIGCNILINQIPDAGKIFVIHNGVVRPKNLVLDQWRKTLFLRDQGLESRGWLVEVMKCVEEIGKEKFEIEDVYAFENHLSAIYPNNRHVRQKIRQQLQVLRDQGFLRFLSRGQYQLNTAT